MGLLLSLRPKRVIHLGTPKAHRFCGASDAAYESGQGSGGFLLIHQVGTGRESRWAREVIIPPEAYELWNPQATYIAQLELAMVLCAMINLAPLIRNNRGLWFVDNTAALHALVRGRSKHADLDRMAEVIHLAFYTWNIWCYFEWIESDSNWADGISRDGLSHEFHKTHAFSEGLCEFCWKLFSIPSKATLLIFQYLA